MQIKLIISSGGVVLRRLLSILLSVVLCSCANRFDSAPTDGEILDMEYNVTLERLHSYLPPSGYYDVTTDLVIRGSVTATDESGNFYKSFVIEQDGYGVEVLEGLTYSYVRHDEGYEVVVHLKGLRLSRSRGVVQIGLPASASSLYDLDYLEHEVIVDRHIHNTGSISHVEPRVVTLSQLADDALVQRLAGSLVEIRGVRLVVDPEVGSGAALWGGSLEFADADGGVVGCYTSPYSDFSMCEVPTGEVTLRGILQSDGAGSPMVKLRRESDCVRVDL